jgi:hypothetical protein
MRLDYASVQAHEQDWKLGAAQKSRVGGGGEAGTCAEGRKPGVLGGAGRLEGGRSAAHAQ